MKTRVGIVILVMATYGVLTCNEPPTDESPKSLRQVAEAANGTYRGRARGCGQHDCGDESR